MSPEFRGTLSLLGLVFFAGYEFAVALGTGWGYWVAFGVAVASLALLWSARRDGW